MYMVINWLWSVSPSSLVLVAGSPILTCISGAIFHAANWDWPQEDPDPEFLGKDWQKEIKPIGFLKEVVVIRPSLLTGGDDITAKGNYRTSLQELKGAYTISRSEVAHFVVERVSKHWDDWKGKVISITGK